MIVILKPNVSEARRDQLISWFKAQNLGVHISQGDYQTVLGLIGDTKSVDMDLIASLDICLLYTSYTARWNRLQHYHLLYTPPPYNKRKAG